MEKNGDHLYTVGETGMLTGVTRKTLFYYDRIKLLSPSCRSGPQQHKLYSEAAVERLRTIQRLRSAGLRIDEVRRALASDDEGKKMIYSAVYERLLREKDEKEEQIRRLLKLASEL